MDMVLAVSIHATHMGFSENNDTCFEADIQLYKGILR